MSWSRADDEREDDGDAGGLEREKKQAKKGKEGVFGSAAANSGPFLALCATKKKKGGGGSRFSGSLVTAVDSESFVSPHACVKREGRAVKNITPRPLDSFLLGCHFADLTLPAPMPWAGPA